MLRSAAMPPRAASIGAFLATLASLAGMQAPRYDLLILRGTVVDGTGAPARRADVAVRHGRVVALGTFPRAVAAETIDATGLVVAPGFIDVHTHADDIADTPGADNFIRMGVTSVVAGNCGGSALDVGAALSRLRETGIAVNYATLIGHNTVRSAAMGTANRDPTVAETARMRSLVWRAMADGAVGFSTGLQYVPGSYARTPEILDLARIAGNAGGLYASHIRNEGTELEQAVLEAIRVGEVAGCRVQLSHLKVDSPSHWGSGARALALIDAARARRVDVQADQYAYTAASSTLGIRFPAWALEGGQEATAARLNDPATWITIKAEMRELLRARGLDDLSFAAVASYSPDASLQGLSMKQIAVRLRGSDSADAQLDAARELMLRGGASMVYHLMSEEDVGLIMRHPWVAIASDSGVLVAGAGVPHPRGYGNTARVLGEYVRVRRVLGLEEAVRKMTSLPAEHFRFERRGKIKEGYAADIAVFDRARVSDAATFVQPHAFPTGVPYVIVNGVVAVRNGQQTGARAGQVLMGTAVAP
ncbi:MAG: D-aminoacylase [Acidobacteriota bacterium]|nr:D-aminoacylase [Acidobacteriota bacterium]